ncbi:MAG: peptide chain release factor N(5)-glutamine methyltransferase [Gemmatimonadota bacterium]|nr:peptide chain release factor N(5)-glutamine methyltransferase [Gemmatimonadota bacterium]
MESPERESPGPGSRRPYGPTRSEIVEGIATELAAAGVESARLEAERLVSGILGITRGELATAGGERVNPDEALGVARAVSRRLDGEPLQHVEGSVDFRTLVLVSDGRALIPRPETEQLVDVISEWVARDGPFERVLEIGVGSAAIALSLLSEGLAVRALGVDVSGEALAQAAENAERVGVPGLELRSCGPEIWPDLAGESPFDLVVSNPPYVASADVPHLDVEVRLHEPRVALDGGPDGLEVVRAVLAGVPAALAPGGRVLLEIGSDQGARVARLLAGESLLEVPRIRTDLAGRDRFVTARRAS